MVFSDVQNNFISIYLTSKGFTMRYYFFTAKIAILCNISYVLCLGIQHNWWKAFNEALNSYLITIGWLMSPIFNSITLVLFLFLNKKERKEAIATCLINSFCLLFFLLHYLYYNS